LSVRSEKREKWANYTSSNSFIHLLKTELFEGHYCNTAELNEQDNKHNCNQNFQRLMSLKIVSVSVSEVAEYNRDVIFQSIGKKTRKYWVYIGVPLALQIPWASLVRP